MVISNTSPTRMSVLCAIVSCEVKGTLELNLATVTCNMREMVKCSVYSTHTVQYITRRCTEQWRSY